MAYDGDTSDLTYNDYIYPSYSGYTTAYGHTDWSGDSDYGYVSLSSSGYYSLSSTGNTNAYIYDATADSWVYGSSYQSGLYLNSGHSNYVYVYGYTTGESYSVSVA